MSLKIEINERTSIERLLDVERQEVEEKERLKRQKSVDD